MSATKQGMTYMEAYKIIRTTTITK